MKKIEMWSEATVVIKMSDDAPDIYARAAEDGFPYWNHDGTRLTPEQVRTHLAHNALSNGITDISDLDGFGDFPRGAVTMRVDSVEVIGLTEETVVEE